MQMAMRVQFLHRHVGDTVIILVDGKIPHPQCPRCNMLVPRWDLNGWYVTTNQCNKGAGWKRQRLAEEETREGAERAYQAYGRPLVTVTAFKCLGQIFTASDDNYPVVVGNLRKALKSWTRIERILIREGAIPRVSGIFFKAVVQAVILFPLEIWVMTSRMVRALGSFQHRVARWITGRQPHRKVDGSWEYMPLETDMEEAGLEDMREYVLKSQNMAARYIAMLTILDLCEETVRMPGAWVTKRWWQQEVLYIV